MKRDNVITLYSVAADAVANDRELQTLLDRASPAEADAIARALRSAYKAGQDDSDARTGKLMARIFGGFVGVTPGIDMNHADEATTPRERMRSIVSMLAGLADRRRQ
jgi:hypothetical protein